LRRSGLARGPPVLPGGSRVLQRRFPARPEEATGCAHQVPADGASSPTWRLKLRASLPRCRALQWPARVDRPWHKGHTASDELTDRADNWCKEDLPVTLESPLTGCRDALSGTGFHGRASLAVRLMRGHDKSQRARLDGMHHPSVRRARVSSNQRQAIPLPKRYLFRARIS